MQAIPVIPAVIPSRSGVALTLLRRRYPLPRSAAEDGAKGASSSNGAGAGAIGGHNAGASEPESAAASSGKRNGVAAPAAQFSLDEEPANILDRGQRFFAGSKLDKARLAALGFGAFSAYGVISNINAGILITIAWLTLVRTTGLTPLDGANWPRFLAIYAGLWIGSNFLRPIRLTLALAAAPLFDAAIGTVARRTGLPKVPAFVLMLVLIAMGTTSTLVAMIALLGGFPPGCRMPWQGALN